MRTLLLPILILAALAGGDAPLGPGEVHPHVHGMGPAIEQRLLEQFEVRRRQEPDGYRDIHVVRIYATNRRHRDTLIPEIIDEMTAAAEAGARVMWWDGLWAGGLPYDEGAHELIEDVHWANLRRLLPAWREQHPDVTLAIFVRGHGSFNPPWGFQGEGYDRYRAVTDPFVKLGFRWIGIDASQRQPWIGDLAFRELEERGITIVMEAIGDPTIARFPPRMIAANVLVQRYGAHIPAVPEGQRWKVWVSKHKLPNGQTAWEARGMTRPELMAELRSCGWTVMHEWIDDLQVSR